ncbi:N-acetyl-alpha-D-glucosaminyl L-malate synthase BshA [Candidatus Daviesbacteria bacterium]|nr:N-acetyl-alpha-D-glucosaminyl L-malate synthase BshA [Candidatus Daviesbacteria bacterium]
MREIVPGKINIGIVCSSSIGGSGVVGSDLAKYLSKNNKYKIVYIGFDLPLRLSRSDIFFHTVKAVEHALFTNPLRETALVEGIIEAVIEHKLDIIHAHFAIPFAYCALQAREILKRMGINIKVVTTLHGTDVLTLGREVPGTMKYVLEQSNAVTAVSVDLAEKAKRIYHTQKNIRVIYNFIDLNRNLKHKANLLGSTNIPKTDKKIFIHISNFRPIKKVNDTLKVFAKVNKQIPSVLLLIGEGPEFEIAKKLCKSVDKSQSIHFMGIVKNPYKYLQIADGLIVTSEYESFCLVGLEAMSFGVPVFSTKVGGIPEVVKHGKSGYLAKYGDIEALSQYIIRHFSYSNKALLIKEQAQELSKNFAAENIIPQYEQIYRQLYLSKNQITTTMS